MSVFSRFSPRLQQAIVARLGWSSLRPVQEEAGEAMLDGMNAVILAPTAGGKTEAAFFPALSALMEDEPLGCGVVYLAPIKALLNNQEGRLGLYTEMVGLNRFVWHGDTTSNLRRHFLSEPPALLMTTPESLEVMLISQRVDPQALFGDLRLVIIDEIHAIAGSDRGAHLISIIERLARLSRHDLQRVGLSATVGNPEVILGWLRGSSQRAGVVIDPPRKPGRKQLLVTHQPELGLLARDAAKLARGCKSLLFCQSRATTEMIAETMRRAGTEVFVHHSAVSREERALAEERFHYGSDACIVCTSTLELGIDVGDLDRVLQADAPATVGSFLQRMGRTGRREGQAANMTFFCESAEAVLQATALIELAKAGWVEDVKLTTRCWSVFIHQLLAMALANDGVAPDDAWAHLSRIPDFSGITHAEYERLLKWMVQDQSLLLVGGELIIGPKTERHYGRRNFMEIFAVFTSPQSYKVRKPDGGVLGTLNQTFVDNLVEDMSCFLLGGRGWLVQHLDHDHREVIVTPAPRGKRPTWGGYLPQFLGRELCQKILAIITADDLYPYHAPSAATALQAHRDAFASQLSPTSGGLVFTQEEFTWWTFAGGLINATLRQALLAIGCEWTIIPDNFSLKFRGDGLSPEIFRNLHRKLQAPGLWQDQKLWQQIGNALPTYRLSKFQPLMPPWVAQETIANYLLDADATCAWLTQSIASPTG